MNKNNLYILENEKGEFFLRKQWKYFSNQYPYYKATLHFTDSLADCWKWRSQKTADLALKRLIKQTSNKETKIENAVYLATVIKNFKIKKVQITIC